jgi:hypothetical protein
MVAIRFTCRVCALYIVNTRKRGIILCVFIDDVIELLLTFANLGLQNTDIFRGHRFINMSTTSTVIGELVTILFVDPNIIHVVANCAELHRFIDISLYFLYVYSHNENQFCVVGSVYVLDIDQLFYTFAHLKRPF